MSRRRSTDLAARLRPHLPRHAAGDEPWWAPPGVGDVAARAAALEAAAVRACAGWLLPDALGAARAAHPAVLDPLDGHLRTGATLPGAVRAWARAVGCPDLGVLAADLRAAPDAAGHAAAVEAAAVRLRARASDREAARVARRARVVTVAGTLAAVGSALVVAAGAG